MPSSAADAGALRLNDYVARYERAQEQGDADLALFLPGPADPLYLPTLRELVRLDLEYGWQRGRPATLADYRQRFPELFLDAASVQEMAFEEYRLRCQAGEAPAPESYHIIYGVNTGGWPGPPGCPGGPGQGAAGRLADALARLPEPGTRFLNFLLVAELGRGAFGRVYLAEQDDLAGRPVALKVATDLDGESRALAQLQHTNIVPVYSVHRCPPLQAVCMPYLGRTTLADVLRASSGRLLPSSGRELVRLLAPLPAAAQEQHLPRARLARLPYVDAVLWVGARLADGLAHAHERGILHLDLKPANVLLTDEGQPMLLDFNLSQEVRRQALGLGEGIGGTLPYMAPEHLEAFDGGSGPLDGRCDVYGLGVILFELLTGRLPFDVSGGDSREVVAGTLAGRRGPPPLLRCHNPAVTPAAEGIVRRCLEPDPARRYRGARELQEDLERQLQHLPLRHAPEPSLRERARKWVRRNPRLAPAAALLAVCSSLLLVLLALLVGRGRRIEGLEAAEAFRHFREEARAAQLDILSARTAGRAALDDALGRCRALLGRYRVPEDPLWQEAPAVRGLPPEDRRRLGEEAGDLLLLWAAVLQGEGGRVAASEALRLNRAAESGYPPGAAPAALRRQRAGLLRSLGRGDEARAVGEGPAAPPGSARDLSFAAAELAREGRYAEALARLEEATRTDPRSFWAWLDRGLCNDQLGRHAEAAACYSTCLALAPGLARLHHRRGLALLHLKKYPEAEKDFDEVLRRETAPGRQEAYVNRALARMGGGEHRAAVDDLTRALESGAAPTRIYFIRARARRELGDEGGARRDWEEGLRRRPEDEQSWLARGAARAARGPEGALRDFEAALALNPRSATALQNVAHVLAERLGRTAEAVRALDRLLRLYPDHAAGRAGRGVLLARLGKRPDALADAEDCLRRDDRPETHYQVAGIYALTSRQDARDRRPALRHLARALRSGYGLDLLGADRDLDPIRDDPEFLRLVAAMRDLP